MELKQIEKQLKSMWKNIFHDSDEYIELLFKTYFSRENVFIYEENDKIVSSILSIPYFLYRNGKKLKVRYLCGLSTLEEFRGNGIMKKLLDQVNEESKSKDYAFTFLIPASDSLRYYYQRLGYQNLSYRVENRFTNIHDFRRDYINSIKDENEHIQRLKIKSYDQYEVEIFDDANDVSVASLKDYIHKCEETFIGYSELLHSSKDVDAIIKENSISGGKIFIVQKSNNEINCVLFISEINNTDIVIPKIYFSELSGLYKGLEAAKEKYLTHSLRVYLYPDLLKRNGVFSQYYLSSEDEYSSAVKTFDNLITPGIISKPYGMGKVLNLSEILSFISEGDRDVNFSFFVKNYPNNGKITHFMAKEGNYQTFEYSENQVEEEFGKSITSLFSPENICALLLRKKDTTSLMRDILGIPRLACNMALLLD